MKWRKFNAFVDTGATLNFAHQDVMDNWLESARPFRIDTMNGMRHLNKFALDVPIRINDVLIGTADFVQISDSGFI